MKHPFLALLPLVGSLFLAGCGPSVGGDCESSGYVCDSETQALECRQGTWRALPCKGALGCSEVNGNIRCDASGNGAGDACAASAEGRAQCRPDGLALLECRMGVLVETLQCRPCSPSGSEVTCTQ
jgi:hypothetical protein